MATPKDKIVDPLLLQEQALAQKVINMYPKISGDHPSAWALFSDDHSKSTIHHGICHAIMVHSTSSGVYDQCITAVPNQSDAALLYLRWLISGPFKQWAKYLKIKKLKSDYYILIKGLDTIPANVVFNFCIATRVPIEWLGLLDNWYTLVGAGVSPSLALLCTMRVDENVRMTQSTVTDYQKSEDPLEWTLTRAFGYTGHFWLDNTCNWYLVLRNEPAKNQLTSPYKGHPGAARPCNNIWGMMDRVVHDKLTGKTVKDVMAFFTDKEIASDPDPDPFVSQPGQDDEVLLDEDFDDDDDEQIDFWFDEDDRSDVDD